jgi:sugar O-acyltransferase (sialic acid O-acetyltransferase NeuD family)
LGHAPVGDRPIVVIGSSSHSIVVAEAALACGQQVIGFLAREHQVHEIAGIPVVTDLETFNPKDFQLALGIGANFQREDACAKILNRYPEIALATVIHPSASVSSTAEIGDGAVLLSHTSVIAGAKVGRGALLNTGSSLDHDSNLGSFASLGPGARTAGNVTIGDRTVIGLNAGILQGLTIGSDSVIGANALVSLPIGSGKIAWGTPAQVSRSRSRNEPY